MRWDPNHLSVVELQIRSCWNLPCQLLLSGGCSVSLAKVCTRVWRAKEQIWRCGIWSCTFPFATFNEKCSEEITLLVWKGAEFCSTFLKTDSVVIVSFPFHGPRLQNKKLELKMVVIIQKFSLINFCPRYVFKHPERTYEVYIPSGNQKGKKNYTKMHVKNLWKITLWYT